MLWPWQWQRKCVRRLDKELQPIAPKRHIDGPSGADELELLQVCTIASLMAEPVARREEVRPVCDLIRRQPRWNTTSKGKMRRLQQSRSHQTALITSGPRLALIETGR